MLNIFTKVQIEGGSNKNIHADTLRCYMFDKHS